MDAKPDRRAATIASVRGENVSEFVSTHGGEVDPRYIGVSKRGDTWCFHTSGKRATLGPLREVP